MDIHCYLRGVGFESLLIMVREETKEVRFKDLFLSLFPPPSFFLSYLVLGKEEEGV